MIAYDSNSFSAGQDTGTRVAACVARLAALELTDHSRWWNRWKHRQMARALVAFAEELELEGDQAHGSHLGRFVSSRGLSYQRTPAAELASSSVTT
ncbi:hypothetical protein [Anaeromyxobacter paludicola]|uniref:Uncharacterized protein n=1 Tax=Anaeromyxobacter paludicola TaxID=2918171 RepID=A0ABN6N9B7_9BACT|nr:hypothetical protein [Anaeromyxobacter paludicola]BDG08572.1 hypothetical protein AMPC_16850 [Anaeromyxobacter paludicola]